MRDPNLVLKLLREMEETVDGRVLVALSLGASDERRQRHHHVEILVDAGYAEWTGEGVARITNDGYDFLNAVEQGGRNREQFDQWLARGMRFADAASKLVHLVSAAAG